MSQISSYRIDRGSLPAQYPTQAHSPELWEELGRAIATFGFLEETLGKAIFGIGATTAYDEKDVQEALQKWLAQLPLNLTDALVPLAERYEKAVKQHQTAHKAKAEKVAADIKRAADIRNALCHGSWRRDLSSGKAELYFFNRKGQKFAQAIDIEWLRRVRAEALQLICDVVDSVTELGWQFPGSAGPGQEVWPTGQ